MGNGSVIKENRPNVRSMLTTTPLAMLFLGSMAARTVDLIKQNVKSLRRRTRNLGQPFLWPASNHETAEYGAVTDGALIPYTSEYLRKQSITT